MSEVLSNTQPQPLPDQSGSTREGRFSLALATRKELALRLGLDPRRLDILLWGGPMSEHYRSFSIRKRSGGTREIHAPRLFLLEIQRQIASALQDVYKPPPGAHGYVRGRSIHSNAALHVHRREVLNFDLENFFPTINFGRVRGVFDRLGCVRPVSTALAQLCCLERSLPIGGAASPVISNFVCYRMDREFQRLGSSVGATYSRYADDITFSTDRRRMPARILTSDLNGKPILSEQVRNIVARNGFTENPMKTRLANGSQRQSVTGITVNLHPNVRSTYGRNLRAMIHNLDKDGYAKCQADMALKYGRDRRPGASPEFGDVLLGRIAFLGQTRGLDDEMYASVARCAQQVLGRTADAPPRFKRWEPKISPTPRGGMMAANEHRKVFVSYSRQDRKWVDELLVRLKPLIRESDFEVWEDSRIRPGSDFMAEIESAIFGCRVALLVVSAHFFASDFIARDEIPKILVQAESKGIKILPLIVGHCRFIKEPQLSRFQALNNPAEPLESLTPAEVSKVLQRAADEVEELLK